MKRYGKLFDEVCSFENLLKAAKKAQRGKRFKQSTAAFNLELERNLLSLQSELQSGKYRMGQYRHFYVFDPKRRFICAAPYADRVVQHAFCNIINPLFEKSFIYDSYACRKEKGTHKAVERFTGYARKNVYALKCDVRNYFAAIDHAILFGLVRQKIKDAKVLDLIRIIIDSAADPGIPIGNLSSQIFANLYLNALDHFIKEKLKCRYYLRYMDDLILFDNDKRRLADWKERVADCLARLKLELHQNKSHIYQTKAGINFLGYKIYPTHRLIIRQNISRFRKRMKNYLRQISLGFMQGQKAYDSVQSWLGYAGQADSYQLRQKLAAEFAIQGISP